MISKKGDEVTPFLVMEVAEEAVNLQRQGADIVSFAVGEPDFETPECVKEAAVKAMRDGYTHYTHSLGLLELREAICQHYWERYRVQVTPDRVLVTSGTSPALFMLFAALLDPGDEVILSNPYYSCYPNFVRYPGGQLVCVNTQADDGYQLHAAEIQRSLTARTKVIMINSPANPTGTVMSGERMSELADLGPVIVSDEIYHGLVYEGRAHSMLEYTERACVLNGFSKLYAMTGWRLGYVIAPPPVIRTMQKLQQNFLISANAFVQRAGLAALREAGPDVAKMVATYAQRRVFMLDRLRALGFAIPCPPAGAFYVLVDARRYGADSMSLALDILRNAHVAVTPGIDFGSNAEGHLRFSYATSIDRIAEGMDRLGQYFERSSTK